MEGVHPYGKLLSLTFITRIVVSPCDDVTPVPMENPDHGKFE
jgi:hypothetical protein